MRSIFGVLNDEMCATEPESVKEGSKSGASIARLSSVRDKAYVLDSGIIIVLTIWLNLDVPEVRLVKAYDRCSIFGSVLESEVFLILD